MKRLVTMLMIGVLAASAGGAGVQVPSPYQGTIWGVTSWYKDGGAPGEVFKVDMSTGTVTARYPQPQYGMMTAIACIDANTAIVANTDRATSVRQLSMIDMNTGLVISDKPYRCYGGLTFEGGVLYGLTGNPQDTQGIGLPSDTYSINYAAGTDTFLANHANTRLGAWNTWMAKNPVDGLYTLFEDYGQDLLKTPDPTIPATPTGIKTEDFLGGGLYVPTGQDVIGHGTNYKLWTNIEAGMGNEDWIWDLTGTLTGSGLGIYGLAVPEPATMSLLVLGGLAVIVRRRRK